MLLMVTMTAKRKAFKEEIAKFFESPSREGMRDLLKNNLGEFPDLDFKAQWPTLSKLARHLLGFANLGGGGCIIIGVAEKGDKTLESKGVDALIDKSTVMNGIKKFLPDTLLDDVEILDFVYEASEYPALVGKKFQVAFVTGDNQHLPFVSMADGDGIRSSAIYVRRGSSTEEANYDELQNIINRRLETGYSSRTEIDVRTHIEQLKMLYGHIDKYNSQTTSIMKALEGFSMISGGVPNPLYPKESLDEFIGRIIEKKKKRIEIVLDVADL